MKSFLNAACTANLRHQCWPGNHQRFGSFADTSIPTCESIADIVPRGRVTCVWAGPGAGAPVGATFARLGRTDVGVGLPALGGPAGTEVGGVEKECPFMCRLGPILGLFGAADSGMVNRQERQIARSTSGLCQFLP